jgi:Flp pilus assembly pilin Flp
MLGVHLAALRRARQHGERGASAVELAIITAMILGIALVLLIVIKKFVLKESSQIHG